MHTYGTIVVGGSALLCWALETRQSREGQVLDHFLADAVVVIHLLFIAFAVFGALLVCWQPRWAYVHLPALCWAALVVLFGWECPLTPLEFHFREQGYTGGFIEHYLWPMIYPRGLTRSDQVGLGLALLLFNFGVYAGIIARRRRRHTHDKE